MMQLSGVPSQSLQDGEHLVQKDPSMKNPMLHAVVDMHLLDTSGPLHVTPVWHERTKKREDR